MHRSAAIARFACVIVFSGVTAGCFLFRSSNPYKSPVAPGIDTLEAAPDERPQPAELSTQRAAVVVLPVLDKSGRAPQGLTSLMTAKTSAIIGSRSNASIVSGDDVLQQLVREQKRSASSVYDQGGAVEIGKLLPAKYVAGLSLDTLTMQTEMHSSEPVYDKKTGKQISPAVSWWETAVTAGMSFSIIDAQTGEYVVQKSAMRDHTSSTSYAPKAADHLDTVRRTMEEGLDEVTEGLGMVFPFAGYILQTRGERDWVLINLGDKDGVKPGNGFYVYTIRTTQDPVSGKLIRQHVRVGEITTDQPDPLGYWCRTEDGEKSIRVGMLVKSNGKVD